MAVITWDDIGERRYESGVDRGVLYTNGIGVPWNGLLSVVENSDKETEAVYYDGMKIIDLMFIQEFSGKLKAITYPDEFVEIEGYGPVSPGMYLGGQWPQTFDLSYRTYVGNDVDGYDGGYKVHILYNLTAIPSDKSHDTIAGDLSFVEFEWDILGVPQEVTGYRPASHVILDSTICDPGTLQIIEEVLYGTVSQDAALVSLNNLISLMSAYYAIQIVDNGDGTYTIYVNEPGILTFDPGDPDKFTLDPANVIFDIPDPQKFYISDSVAGP